MPPARQPWPMKWIVLAIAAFIALYTFLTLHYRKPGPGYLPYQDSRQRANLAQLGYRRITLKVDRPADPRPIVAEAPVAPAAGGLPADLLRTLLPPPLLPATIGAVAAAPAADAGHDRLTVSCARDDGHEDLATRGPLRQGRRNLGRDRLRAPLRRAGHALPGRGDRAVVRRNRAGSRRLPCDPGGRARGQILDRASALTSGAIGPCLPVP